VFAGPARIVVAVPVGSAESCVELRSEADEAICLYTPEPLWAVRLYCDDFNPTEDHQVGRLLAHSRVGRSYANLRRPKGISCGFLMPT